MNVVVRPAHAREAPGSFHEMQRYIISTSDNLKNHLNEHQDG